MNHLNALGFLSPLCKRGARGDLRMVVCQPNVFQIPLIPPLLKGEAKIAVALGA